MRTINYRITVLIYSFTTKIKFTEQIKNYIIENTIIRLILSI